MNGRERVAAAVAFRPVDRPPLLVASSMGGLYEHGRKLATLMRETGHDFGDLRRPPPPPPEDFDAAGQYDAYRTDAWGVGWRYRTFGVWGTPVKYPLQDLADLDRFQPPALPWSQGPQFEVARTGAAEHRRHYYRVSSGGSIFELMHSLRPFEDVLVEVMSGDPAIHRLCDILTDYSAELVRRAVLTGTDAVSIGDDFGTQQAMLFPPDVWRAFFKPRYRRIFAPALAADVKIFFHSCGEIRPILKDLAELGVSVIWPQLSLWTFEELAKRCRELGLAVQLHPDRGELMQRGTPGQIRRHLRQMDEAFAIRQGGSFLYVEIDPGFPWPNVEALFEAIAEMRT
jgi:uroporphyrinogen decarboxylase